MSNNKDSSLYENVAFYHATKPHSMTNLQRLGKMHGARRVICFCCLTAVLPTILVIIPLYLRHKVFADETYLVAESDVLEIQNGVSSIFCQKHSLTMNTTFSAFQVDGEPEVSNTSRKHIRLKKSMSLPDDTLEYWGFYLPKGSTVNLSVCSRYDGSRLLVVKGEKNLRSCGLNQPSITGSQAHMAEGEGRVFVTFEMAQEITTAMEAPNEKNIGGEVTDSVFDFGSNENIVNNNGARKLRHQKRKVKEHYLDKAKKDDFVERKLKLQEKLNGNVIQYKQSEDLAVQLNLQRIKRRINVAEHKLDGGMVHGGNAKNITIEENDSSVSSFEESLRKCYDGNILLTEGFPPSHLCTNVSYLETHSRMVTTHQVTSDGYYYYIFYSDNDYVLNDIHAIFNIHKPTYQFGNYTKGCINNTECSFDIPFLSSYTIVVEVPTRDGIEHEEDDITKLISTCHPRMAVYAIFPISVLFLILGCAFL